jgi:septal ring factor EnvC (AmiA/AmiB activator)
MILADADVSQGAAALACVIAVSSALFAWLTKRDALKYDARILKLEADQAACHEGRERDKAEIAVLRAQNGRQQAEIDSLKASLAEAKTDRAAVHAELTKLKGDMTARGLRADSTEVKIPDSKQG